MASDGLLSPSDVRALAAELELQPAKRLGQNFMIDSNTVRRIVRLADVGAGDAVLEIGPGLGSLTLGLLDAGAWVLAIEIDQRLAQLLPRTVAARRPDVAGRLTVVGGDAMRLPLPIALPVPEPVLPATGPEPEVDSSGCSPSLSIMVANLPYNVAVPVLLRILADQLSVQRGLVLVQAEVADRLAAQPGSRSYGAPSVKLQWYGNARLAGEVPASVFWPRPRVESKLVAFKRGAPPASTSTRVAVFACIDAAFGQRRKTLRQALQGWAGSARAASEILELAQVDTAVRGEVLTVGDFGRISDARLALTAT